MQVKPASGAHEASGTVVVEFVGDPPLLLRAEVATQVVEECSDNPLTCTD